MTCPLNEANFVSFIKAQIEHFEPHENWIKIGAGFYSDVYCGKFLSDNENNEKVHHAIKVIKTADRTLDQTHQAVDKEAEILIHLRHENMLSLTGVYLPSDHILKRFESETAAPKNVEGEIISIEEDCKSLGSVTTANSDDILYKNVSPIFKNGIIITPYYPNGDIKTYCENSNYLLSDDLVFQWCYQLSSSVAYDKMKNI